MQSGVSRRSFIRSASVAAAGTTAAGMSSGAPALARKATGLPDPDRVTETDPALLSAVQAASLLRARELHPVELLDACLQRSTEFDGATTAWVRTYPEVAYEQARRAARRLADGDAPALCGLPIAVKDLYAVSGLPLTASSRVLEGNIAAGDATIWRRLADQGAVLLGHAHTDEFALLTATPQVGNPWKTDQTVGGSSGGSGAALAARYAPLALGTDTGGSARIPAARCGVSTIKPTFGRCSRYGIIPVTGSRDHAAPMGRSIGDASLLLSSMVGSDVDDPSTAVAPPAPESGFPLSGSGRDKPLSGKAFGIPRASLALPPELDRLFNQFLDLLTRLGGALHDVTMPPDPVGLVTGDAVELGLYHQQFTDRTGSYAPPGAAIVQSGLASLAIPVADYLRFEQERGRYQRSYNRLFAENGIDAVVFPGTVDDGMERNAAAVSSVIGTNPIPVLWANHAGVPVVSLPAGRSATTGLPFGVQLGGLPWSEADLIEIGIELQEADDGWNDVPPLAPTRRAIPEVGRTAPGEGPNPTNTLVDPPAIDFVPTTGTGE